MILWGNIYIYIINRHKKQEYYLVLISTSKERIDALSCVSNRLLHAQRVEESEEEKFSLFYMYNFKRNPQYKN